MHAIHSLNAHEQSNMHMLNEVASLAAGGEDGVARKLPRVAPEATVQEPLPRHLDEPESMSKAAASESRRTATGRRHPKKPLLSAPR